MEYFDAEVKVNRTQETIRESMNISAKDNLGYYD
jgi:hypothetical protein